MRVQLLKYGSFLVNMSVLYLPTGCVYVTNCSRIFVRSSWYLFRAPLNIWCGSRTHSWRFYNEILRENFWMSLSLISRIFSEELWVFRWGTWRVSPKACKAISDFRFASLFCRSLYLCSFCIVSYIAERLASSSAASVGWITSIPVDGGSSSVREQLGSISVIFVERVMNAISPRWSKKKK